MKIIRAIMIATICMTALGSFALADTAPTLTLAPVGGAITGTAGSAVGWGFTLTNLGTDFAVISGSDFCVGPITSPCSNSFGTYTDFAGPQFILVGPSPESSSFTQAFDKNTQLGIGSFFINQASVGSVLGQIALTYDLFSVDPNSIEFDPIVDTDSVGNYLTAQASVTVAQPTSAPEPGSLMLLTAGFLMFFAVRQRIR